MTTLVVCRKCKQSACLVEVLHAHGDHSLELVRCQKICKGPVVGVAVDGRMEWFQRLDGVRSIAALLRLARTRHPAKIPKPLRKLRVKKHRGRPPR
jgi:hypothetical protein